MSVFRPGEAADLTPEAVAEHFRVLVVAYYFPPLGLSGVQRVAKFVKYLPDFRWVPTVLTVDAKRYYAFDESLAEELRMRDIEVHRTHSRDPLHWFGKNGAVAMPPEGRRKVLSRISQFVFIPDNKIGWRKHAVAKGKELLASRNYDVIFSTAPPYTAHLIGLELSRHAGLPLVTDFRDDWVGNPLHSYPTGIHRRRHLKLERDVIQRSNAIVTINRAIQDQLVRRHFGAEGYRRVSVIPHGYDPDDFGRGLSLPAPSEFRLVYSGTFYDARQPDDFLHGLARFLERRPDAREHVRARFVGLFPDRAVSLVKSLGLDSVVERLGYVPHVEAVGELESAAVLWMIVGRQEGDEMISTGKLFEYMGARKPILGIVPEGHARKTLEQYGAGVTVPPESPDQVADALSRLYVQWLNHRLPTPDPEFVQRFDRQVLTGELADVFRSTLQTV